MSQSVERIAVCVLTCSHLCRHYQDEDGEQVVLLPSAVESAVRTYIESSYLLQQEADRVEVEISPICKEGLMMGFGDLNVRKHVSDSLYEATYQSGIIIFLILDHPNCACRSETDLNIEISLLIASLRDSQRFVYQWLESMNGWLPCRPIAAVMAGVVVQDRNHLSIMSVPGYESRAMRVITDMDVSRLEDDS